jgi:hypothetical protein
LLKNHTFYNFFFKKLKMSTNDFPTIPGGSVEVRPSNVGGGRGVFARRDIAAGTVLLVEKPFLEIPEEDEGSEGSEGGGGDDDGGSNDGGNDNDNKNSKSDDGSSDGSEEDAELLLHAAIARHIAGMARDAPDEEWAPLAEGLALLHPRSLTVLSAEEKAGVEEHCIADDAGKIFDEVFGEPSGGGDDAGEPAEAAASTAPLRAWTRDDVLLTLLRVRFNAFGTGLYRLASLVNHRCLPNCMKFGHDGAERPGPDGERGASWTEIVAVTAIPAGTEITISYIDPIERSIAGRIRAFQEQHFADPGPSPFPAEFEALPEAAGTGTGNGRGKDGDDDDDDDDKVRIAVEEEIDTVGYAADYKLALEMVERAVAAFGPKHLVTQRARALAVPTCLAAMDEPKASQTIAPAISLLQVALPLLEYQEAVLGRAHCEVATTMQDVSMAIEHLLSTEGGDARLFATFPDTLGTFGRASSVSFRLKKKSEEIQATYAAGEKNPMPE